MPLTVGENNNNNNNNKWTAFQSFILRHNNNNLHEASYKHVRVVSIDVSNSLCLVLIIYVNSEDTTIFFEYIVN